jgi:hypothetical protein
MSELLRKYESLCASGIEILPPNPVAIKESLYCNLTILDSKASALMAFDGILIAVASFTVQEGGVFASEPQVPLVVIILALVAAGFCLAVAQISYPFLGKVVMTPTSSTSPTSSTLSTGRSSGELAFIAERGGCPLLPSLCSWSCFF